MEEIQLALAALALLEKLTPTLATSFKSGEVDDATQQKVRDEYQSFVDNFDAKFSGPEWEK